MESCRGRSRLKRRFGPTALSVVAELLAALPVAIIRAGEVRETGICHDRPAHVLRLIRNQNQNTQNHMCP